jgi:hypothetical protein
MYVWAISGQNGWLLLFFHPIFPHQKPLVSANPTFQLRPDGFYLKLCTLKFGGFQLRKSEF